MNSTESTLKPAWYRVSVKALIRDKDDRVLFMGENKGFSLPGGGLEHGETIEEALRRELLEELELEAVSVSVQPHSILPYYYPENQKVGMWLVYEVEVEQPLQITNGTPVRWVSEEEMRERNEPGEAGQFLMGLFRKTMPQK